MFFFFPLGGGDSLKLVVQIRTLIIQSCTLTFICSNLKSMLHRTLVRENYTNQELITTK